MFTQNGQSYYQKKLATDSDPQRILCQRGFHSLRPLISLYIIFEAVLPAAEIGLQKGSI